MFYLIAVPLILISSFFLYQYWRELKFRHKPFYKLSDIGWRNEFPTASAKKIYSVALLGDAGGACEPAQDKVMKILNFWAKEQTKESAALFLGDNIYPVGLPPESDLRRKQAENIIKNQLTALKDFKGKIIYLGGNHDWNKGRKNGYDYLLRQEKYVTDLLKDPESYLPRHGCTGPVSIQVAPGVLLLVINTQWWVQRGFRPVGEQYSCESENEHQFFKEFNQILKQNQHQRILIAAHHPLYSNALHGGKFPVKQHLFPLTAAYKRFYFPFPLIGSLYPLYRNLIGASEDMSHTKYKKMRRRLLNVLHKYNNVIYTAGHDHNLQYFNIRKNHYIVSGSVSKLTFVGLGGKATFTHEERGFFTVDFYDNGETWINVLEPSKNQEKVCEIVFRKKIHLPKPEPTN